MTRDSSSLQKNPLSLQKKSLSLQKNTLSFPRKRKPRNSITQSPTFTEDDTKCFNIFSFTGIISLRNVFKQFILSALLISIAFSLTSCMSPPEKALNRGYQLYYQKHYHEAFSNFYFAAQAQLPRAEYATGYMYYYGLGTKKDPIKARIWIRRAAEERLPQARLALKILQKNAPQMPVFDGLT